MDDGTNWWDSFVDWGTDLYDNYAPEVSKAVNTVADTVTGYGNEAYNTVADYGRDAYSYVDNAVDNFEFPSFNAGAGGYDAQTDYGPGPNGGWDSSSADNGLSRSVGSGLTGNSPNVTFNAGAGVNGLSANAGTGGYSFTTTDNTLANEGIAGGLGVTPTPPNGQAPNPALLARNDLNVQANYALDGGGGGGNTFNNAPPPASARGAFSNAVNQAETGLRGVQDFARDNYNVARLGLDLAGMGLSYKNRNDANDLAREQMQMQRAAQQKNAAVADRANAQSAQSFNEARSLYNPQEMAIRSMADAKMANMRAQEAARNQMQKSGRSKGTIDAEMRRAQLAGTTGANTAYLRGLDTGRAAQQSALSNAAGLARTYNTGADYTAADRVAKAGQSNSDQLTAMLNNYLGNPIYQQNAAAQRRAQQDAYYYQ
jgi:hypothetical protein